MTIRGHKLEKTGTGTSEIKDISTWENVGVTVDVSGADTPVGTVEGSRGMGAITDVWEDIMAYSDVPKEIDNSFRRIRLNTTSIVSGTVVAEVSGN